MFTYTINLASREDIYAIADKVKKEVGKVDILINNAGIVSGKPILSPDFKYAPFDLIILIYSAMRERYCR